ncbi:TDT family transporter [Acinetobacter ursingii]|uniref:TDT family transporter n=1 Tax=Acinetobacter ursingii TaxID=108980 RepID=UPI0021CD8D53|nr:TDT family transporter [Acinetobacter ursingii]MCU4482496.1 TDT family transporter [Acinetobacter ursingii]MCU4506864.1 TDT family transporter [Acinetobacter ursingii]MCU4570627.1 TDT family transporter [Acinetobacter ursingii]
MNILFDQMQLKQKLIREFTPNWFAVIMGTGVVALILAHFPFASSSFYRVGMMLWIFNSVLFIVFSVLYLARWFFYPEEAKQILSHPTMSLFLGTIPMALATVLNGFLIYGVPLFGELAVLIALKLWYLDVLLAIVVGWIVPFCMFSRQQHTLPSMTAMWLLPIVAAEVAASSGGLILNVAPDLPNAVTILWSSYILWGMSVLPAFLVLAILVLRLALHQIPPKELAISSWLSIGPIGTGALAMLLLGQAAPQVLQQHNLYMLGPFLQHSGLFIALVFVGVGIWWLGIAIFASLHHLRQGIPFNLGWWGLTFPLGVFILALQQLALQLQWSSLTVIVHGLMMLLLGLWVLVTLKTIRGAYTGQLFFSPCLQIWKQQQENH